MYVYKHTSPSGKVYIGITSQHPKRRWRDNGSGYCQNVYFWRAIQKYGWENFEHEIIAKNLTIEEACNLEKQLIAYYHSDNHEFGYNLDSGGMYAGKHSIETRQKIGNSRKGKYCGKNSPRYGTKHTKETKLKMKKNHANCKGINHPQYGMVGELCHTSKPVIQISLSNNEILSRYCSIKEASNVTGIDESSISKTCKGKQKHSGGYRWQYEDEPHEYVEKVKCNRKKCCQYSKDGQLIATYNSIIEASKSTGIGSTVINKCLKGIYKYAGNYIWKYIDV